MKRSILFLFWFACVFLLVAQPNNYFQHNENWTMQWQGVGCSGQEHISLGGDTTINSEILKKIYYYSGETCGGSIYYYGSISKPLFFAKDSNSLITIYSNDTLTNTIIDTATIDFSRTDSIIVSSNPGYFQSEAITDIDTLWINNMPRKIFYLGNVGYVAFEGTFDNDGNPYVLNYPDFEFYKFIRCYGAFDSIYHIEYFWDIPSMPLPTAGTCQYFYNLSNEIVHDGEYNIYPNPSSMIIKISVAGGDKIDNVIVFNSAGQTKTVTCLNDGLWDVSELANGIYILQIKCNDKIIYKKFIKE